MPRVDILEKLLGSRTRLRLLKLFILNPNDVFDARLIASRTHMNAAAFASELRLLMSIGFIKRSSKVVTLTDVKTRKLSRKKIDGYILMRDFPYLNETAQLIASDAPAARERLLMGARSMGRVELLVTAGQLIGQITEQTDLFIVGEGLKKTKIEKMLAALETDIGKEIIYALMPTREFQYRFGMYDRFIKNLFENPHEILINKIGISLGGGRLA